MNTANSRRIIGGLGRALIDITITLPTQMAEELLLQQGFCSNAVHITNDRHTLLELAQELGKHGTTIVSPGDPVSNTLHMMGICQQASPAPFSLHWLGPTGIQDHNYQYTIDPLDSLRRVSIITHSIASERDDLAVCVVSQETKRVIAIVAQSSQPAVIGTDHLPIMNTFIILLLDLLKASRSVREYISRSGTYAVILGDTVSKDSNSLPLLAELAASGKLKWIIGRFQDVEILSLVKKHKVPHPFRNVEIIGTQSAAPVMIWDPDLQQLVACEVPPVPNFKGSELGAGDAYAGGYLYSRLSQHSIVDAHVFASACARLVLESDSARALPTDDLNIVFGRLIDRVSDSNCEGRLFERVRLAPNLVVVSPGQKGIDQIGINTAAELGVPCFCVLPQDKRTEQFQNEIDRFGDAHIMTLASPSYRYRTWATVFLSDGTLLWDFYGGEGSAATREACNILGRPLLDMTSVDPEVAFETVALWMDRHSIRVINIAGTRGSSLTGEQVSQTASQTKCLLRFLSYRRANVARCTSEFAIEQFGNLATVQERDNLRIGVPNSTRQRELFESFLEEVYGLARCAPRSLYVSCDTPPLEIVFTRPRDLPTMLREKAIDLALCGSDVLYEEQTPFEILLDTGLFQCFIVLVGKDEKRGAGGNETLRIGSQYPRMASELLSRTKMPASLRAIHGTAEAWINIGLVDAAIDTWQTGSAADANNLHLHHIFMCTSLVVATTPSDNNTREDARRRFVNVFGSWLAGKTLHS